MQDLKQALEHFQSLLGTRAELLEEIRQYSSIEYSEQPRPGLQGKRSLKFNVSSVRVVFRRNSLLELLDNINRANGDIERLFSVRETLDQLTFSSEQRLHQDADLSERLKLLREYARALHSFLKKQWPCICQPRHDSAKILLRHKDLLSAVRAHCFLHDLRIVPNAASIIGTIVRLHRLKVLVRRRTSYRMMLTYLEPILRAEEVSPRDAYVRSRTSGGSLTIS